MIIQCPAGVRLQDYLLSQNIHILTACGGRGSCGKCAVRIISGNTAVNTMDSIWFSKAELENGFRLGCQVYAKEPLTVELPDRSLLTVYYQRVEGDGFTSVQWTRWTL